MPITAIEGGLNVTKLGASLTAETLMMMMLDAFDVKVPSEAVKDTFVRPEKFAAGVNVAKPLDTFTDAER